MAPGCYDHAVVRIRHLETHISHLLLTGSYAYKIKKPLNLGFLDFSTLEQRRFYCDGGIAPQPPPGAQGLSRGGGHLRQSCRALASMERARYWTTR